MYTVLDLKVTSFSLPLASTIVGFKWTNPEEVVLVTFLDQVAPGVKDIKCRVSAHLSEVSRKADYKRDTEGVLHGL